MLEVGLVGKEGVIDRVEPFVYLGRFEFEGVGLPCTAPPSTHREVYLLVYHHALFGSDVLKVDRAVPVHIPIARGTLSVARTTIYATYIYAKAVVVKVDGVGDYRNDGEHVISIFIDEGACDNLTGQLAFFVETETINGSVGYMEISVFADISIGEGGGSAVCRVVQCGAFGYLHIEGEGVSEKAGVLVYDRSLHALCGKCACRIAFAGGGLCGNSPFFSPFGSTGIRGAWYGYRVVLTGNKLSLAIADINSAAVIVEFEVYL